MRFARFFLATLVVLGAAGVNAADKPNILIIVVDDMGWHDVPWHGGNYAMLGRHGGMQIRHWIPHRLAPAPRPSDRVIATR